MWEILHHLHVDVIKQVGTLCGCHQSKEINVSIAIANKPSSFTRNVVTVAIGNIGNETQIYQEAKNFGRQSLEVTVIK